MPAGRSSPATAGEQCGRDRARAVGREHAPPRAMGGDRAGIRRHLSGDAEARRVACRDARPLVLQHRLSRGRAAGPSLEDLISSSQHRTRRLQGMQAVRRRVQGGLHRSPEEDGGYQPLRWLLQLLRSLSERRTAIRKQVAKTCSSGAA